MRTKRLWATAGAVVLLLAVMFVLNDFAARPKPPPDVQLEGRLAPPKPAEPTPAAANAETKTATKPATKPGTEVKLKVTDSGSLSADEKKLVENAKGSLVKIETAKGDIYVDLYDETTPVTVGSFLELVSKGFYNGLKFHRVIADFMIQGGDPQGTGAGGPGFTIPDEADKGIKHARGSLSMAKTAAPNTGGSQFFICHSPQAHLNGLHTVFGETVKGLEVVDKIAMGDVMKTVTILKKSDAADADVAQALAARKAGR